MNCIYCGKELNQSRNSTGKYCDNKCQGSHKKEKIIKLWENEEYSINQKIPKSIKEYLLAEQNFKCSICGMSNNWNNKQIIFICDHIDGNSQNNKKENLRLICPNCDSQLETFKGRNRGNGRFLRRLRYKENKSF